MKHSYQLALKITAAIQLAVVLAIGFAIGSTLGPVWGVAASFMAGQAMIPVTQCLGDNSFGTLSPSIVVLRTIEFLKKQFPVLTSIATDLKDEPVVYGQQVIARVVTIPTVADYHVTNGYVASDAATVDVPVTINKHKHVSLSFGEQELSGTNRNLADEQMQAAAFALGKQALADVFALITVANFPVAQEVVETVNNTDRETLTALRKNLTTRGAATMGRYGVVNPDVFEKLTNDTKIISSDYNSEKPDYEGGRLVGVAGFGTIDEWADLPTAESLTGFFGNKASLVLASRVPTDPASLIGDLPMPGKIEVFKDPATGLSLMARFHYDMQKGKLQMTLTWMYGVAKGVVGHAVRLVHTTNA